MRITNDTDIEIVCTLLASPISRQIIRVLHKLRKGTPDILTKEIGVSKSTINRRLNELKARGLIGVEIKADESGKRYLELSISDNEFNLVV